MIDFKRGKSKHIFTYTISDVYKWYRKQKHARNVKQSQFKGITTDIADLIYKEMIYNNYRYYMPTNFGFIDIVKYKKGIKTRPDGTIDKKCMRPDWGRTRAYWEEIYPGKSPQEIKDIKGKKVFYHLNEHTDGYRVKFRWNCQSVGNIRAYIFDPKRSAERELAAFVKNIKDAPFYESKIYG